MESQEKQSDTEEKIVKSASVISVSTFLSRITGFLRDMLFAKILGASIASDAFYVAFRIPNLLRELMAEGSISAGFIPVFTEYLTKRSRTDAALLARATFTLLFLILLVIVGIGIIFAPALLHLIAPGFLDNPELFALATALTRVMFPFLLFISLAALTMGILNSTHRFGPPAISSAVCNIVMILFIVFPFYSTPIFSAAIGVVAGGFCQWAIQLPAVKKEGFSLSFLWPIFPLHPGLITIGKLIVPITISLSVTQINILVSTLVASTLAGGSVSYLYYAMRLIHFPLGIFGVALATVLLPTLSAQAAKSDDAGLRQSLSFGLRLIFFIMAPAMAGLIFLRVPVVHLLFEHGVFDKLATEGTAQAVLYYAIGLWAFAGVRVVVPVFYSMQDTKTPMKVAVLAMISNVILNFVLAIPLQHRGLALATSLSAIFNFIILVILLRKKIGRIDAKRIVFSHIKVILGTICMIPPALFTSNMSLWNASGNWIEKSVLLTITIVVSITIYFITQAILKSEELMFLKNTAKTRFKRAY
ncbi:MAG: murein biosynthesis integral membrane protein MurJ [Nitrospirae bacterium]|nr:murein biosynthesis integral membrane protein MurJ [Candidatus Troglogloeales bacterium]MBI3597900.1 murein biosynthesis integral membrane protein MurJ [Candidatus Troglogloeales bacterium]